MGTIGTGRFQTGGWSSTRSTGDPFGLLDEFLAGHGFGVWSEPFVPAADGLVADLYLGYRLAAALPGVSRAGAARALPPARAGVPCAICRG